MSAHTPGPWSAKPICKDSGWVDIASEFRYCIGYATPLRNGTPAERGDDETFANARLIAAAPDLYEALDRINVAACYASEEDTDAREAVLLHIGELARAALAKAQGAQS